MTASTAALLEDALRQIAGPDAHPTSMTVDYGAAALSLLGGASTSKAWIERSTRSLIFAQAEARTEDGSLVAAASAVFLLRNRAVPYASALVATAKAACYQARGFGQGSASAPAVHALF
jgi:hypothetical protein